MRQRSNSPELSLEQLDEVVGGTATAPMGLGGSFAPPTIPKPHQTAAFGMTTQAHEAFAVPASIAAPVEPLAAPMGLGGSHGVQTAPATHGDPTDREEAVFAIAFNNEHAPQGFGGNR